MAKIMEIDPKALATWLAEKPKVIQDLAARFPLDRLYLLKSTQHRVTMHGYAEDNTLIVSVTGKYNRVVFDRVVFGVAPEDLEECDLPAANEALGTIITEREEVEAYIQLVASEREPSHAPVPAKKMH